MNSGFYALASLNGAPLCERDLAVLGLVDETRRMLGRGVAGFNVCAVDDPASVGSMSFIDLVDGLACFLGYLDEPDALASTLALEKASPPASIASTAIERFGADAPVHMLGEWTFLRWKTLRRELTIVSSEARRDSLFFATDGDRLAISAEMPRLSRLAWVGLTINPLGLAVEMSRAGLRHIERQETACKGILRAFPGSTEIFRDARRTTHYASARSEPEIWRGSFEDAVDALNAMGRRIVGQQMGRYGRTAFLLSGGLDSSLLTSWGAHELGQGRKMFCLSSVAPEGSCLLDEREFSSSVASGLGLPIEFITPPLEWSPYQPSKATFDAAQSPMVSVRHYLVQALVEAAHAKGAGAVVDGVYGELTVTDKTPLPENSAWKRLLRAGRRWVRSKQEKRGWPTEAFHARLSRELLAELPREWEEVWHAGLPRIKQPGATEPAGISPALAKNAPATTATAYGLRHLAPYRDRRLIELAARMPKGFAHQGGLTRSLARAMLVGRIPELVRLRQRGRPFSPDYEMRMRNGATAARERIELFREAGLAQWLDLDWLSGRLEEISNGKNTRIADQFRMQGTATAGEFLLWVKRGARP